MEKRLPVGLKSNNKLVSIYNFDTAWFTGLTGCSLRALEDTATSPRESAKINKSLHNYNPHCMPFLRLL